MRFIFLLHENYTKKGYKAIVGILSKTKHRTFSHSAKGPVFLL